MTKFLGLTLLELMIGIAVAAVLAAIAVPSFRRLVDSTRVNAQATELASALMYVRAEALRRNLNVSICPSAAPSAATPVCGLGPNGWASGWLVFTDGGAAGVIDGADVVLRTGQPSASTALTVSPQYSNWLGFAPTGRPRVANGGRVDGMLLVCDGVMRRGISISLTGRIVRNDAMPDNAACNAPANPLT